MPLNIPTTNRPRIVVIGGGFGGLQVVKGLKTADAQVVWIDRKNYHTFQALLYQVATAGLEPDSIAFPLRKIIDKQRNTVFRMTEVLEIIPDKSRILTDAGEVYYDFLVIAAGARVNYFGLTDVQKNAVPMKSLTQALDLRHLILGNFEKAYRIESVEEREGLTNFIIVGGGPTGVEMAGALGELRRHILPRDYPDLELSKMQIHIVEMQDRLLSFMSSQSSRSAEEFLKNFDINIWLKTSVKSYDGRQAALSNGLQIRANTMIWTAGVKGRILPGLKEDSLWNGNRIKVDHYSRVHKSGNIFAIGDIAAMITDETPQGHPMLAPVAIQQGRHLAKNVMRLLKNETPQPFTYRNFGVMATVGRSHAVAELPFIKLKGFIGWITWLFVHLIVQVGFRNKLVTLINWAWSYLSYDRGLRLIVRPFIRKEQKIS